MMQDAYDHDKNWFARPKFYNNLGQTMDYATNIYRINQVRFSESQRHNNCAYNTYVNLSYTSFRAPAFIHHDVSTADKHEPV